MTGSMSNSVISESREFVLKLFFELRDEDYKRFSSSLIPNLPKEIFIGVRVPELRKIAKRMLRENLAIDYIKLNDYEYYEEYFLCALIISELDYDNAIERLNTFLPLVNNWGVCDSLRPKCFYKNRARLRSEITRWLKSKHPYTVRFAIEVLMIHYMDEDYFDGLFDTVAGVRSDDYYVKMMVGWFFATALTKRWGEAIAYLNDDRLEPTTRKIAIRKGIESLKLSEGQKKILREIRVK